MDEAKGYIDERLKKIEEKANEYSVQEMYNNFEETIAEAVEKFSVRKKAVETDDKLKRTTKETIQKRNEIEERENKTLREKLELLLLRKKAKKEIKTDIREYEENRIVEILKESGSTKKFRKEMMEGTSLLIYIKDNEGRRVHDRKGITQVATEFYRELYKEEVGAKNQERERKKGNEESIPNIMGSEVQHAIKLLKKEKTPGPDKVTNEILKGFEPQIKKTQSHLIEF